MNEYTIVHYGELRLKGRNRIRFENRLINNINKICGGHVEKLGSSLLCNNSDPDSFKYVSGISTYAHCIKLDKDYATLIKHFEQLDFSIFNNKKSFAVKVKRSDKKFEYNSVEIGKRIGSVVFNKTGLSVDLKRPDITVYIEINEYILVYFDKMKGMGGFPAGIHGNLLCLLSGGIDSPVAAYSMIRKGCHVDLLHFHVYSNNEDVYSSKIPKLVNQLNKYQLNTRLFLIPSYIFDFTILNNKNIKGYEMILFRRFIHRIAEIISLKYKYKAIVNGDSLGQVASQTIENIKAVDDAVEIEIFRPLIAMDKQEIIDIARIINTYEISIDSYKDCCSIISSNPQTNSVIDKILELESQVVTDDIIADTMELIESKILKYN